MSLDLASLVRTAHERIGDGWEIRTAYYKHSGEITWTIHWQSVHACGALSEERTATGDTLEAVIADLLDREEHAGPCWHCGRAA